MSILKNDVTPRQRASGRRLKHVMAGMQDGKPSESHDWRVSGHLLP